jgi:hypothetical protein
MFSVKEDLNSGKSGMIINRLLRIICVAYIIGFSSIAIGSESNEDVFGFIIPCKYNDSLFFEFELTAKNIIADSIVWSICCPDVYGIYICNSERQKIDSGATIYNNHRLNMFTGFIFLLTKKNINNVNWIRVITYFTNDSDSTNSITRWDITDKLHWGMGMEVWFPALGYYRSNHTNLEKKGGFLIGWGLSTGFDTPYNSYQISTSFEGHKGYGFHFHEPIKFQYIRHLTNRFKTHPSIFISAKNAKLKLNDIKESSWGIDAGIALESNFERLKYTYSTPLGGYHTFELYMKSRQTNYTSTGTRFRLHLHEKVWSLRVSFFIEGFGLEHEHGTGNPQLARDFRRPFTSKLLMFPGLCSGVAAIIMAVFGYYK